MNFYMIVLWKGRVYFWRVNELKLINKGIFLKLCYLEFVNWDSNLDLLDLDVFVFCYIRNFCFFTVILRFLLEDVGKMFYVVFGILLSVFINVVIKMIRGLFFRCIVFLIERYLFFCLFVNFFKVYREGGYFFCSFWYLVRFVFERDEFWLK